MIESRKSLATSSVRKEGLLRSATAGLLQRLRRVRIGRLASGPSTALPDPPIDVSADAQHPASTEPAAMEPPRSDEQVERHGPIDVQTPSPATVGTTQAAAANKPSAVGSSWAPLVATMEALERQQEVSSLLARAAAAVERSALRQSRQEEQLNELVRVLESAARFAEP